MSAPPFQKLYWGSYHKHTAHLGHAKEHGAYLLLIGALWNNEGRLPADDATLAGYAKLSVKEWEAIKPKLINGTLLKVVRGKLTQPRVTEDLAKYRDTSGKRKEAGKTGGTVSAEKKREKRQAIATDLPIQPEPEPEDRKEEPPTPLKGGQPDLLGEQPADEPAPRRKPKRPIPSGFPTPDLIDAQQQAARAAGADVDVAYQAERFRNWAEGADHRYADWPKTWANWCLRTIREAPRLSGQAPATLAPPIDHLDRWRRRVNAYLYGSKFWNTTDWEAPPGKDGCIVPVEILREFGIGADVLPFEGRAA